MKQKLTIEGRIDSSTIIVEDYSIDKITRQKISKEVGDLKNIIDQLDITDTYRTL